MLLDQFGRPVHLESDHPPDDSTRTLEPAKAAAPEGISTNRQPLPIAEILPAPTKQSESQGSARDTTPPWKNTLEISAVLIALSLLIVNTFQSCATKRSADAAIQAANTGAAELAAQRDFESAELVVSKFDAKLVPLRVNVLGHLIEPAPAQLDIEVALTIKNAGPTVAKEIFIMKNGGSFDIRTTPVQYPPWQWTTAVPLSSGRSLAPADTFVYEPPLPSILAEGVSAGGRIPYFTVGISWRDIFGRPHIITECDYYLGSTDNWRGPCYWSPGAKK